MNQVLPMESGQAVELDLHPTNPVQGEALLVATAGDTLWLCQDGHGPEEDRTVMALPIDDAPAVACAILEAAGHEAAAALVREELEAAS